MKDKSINVTYKAIYEQANDLDELIDYYNTLFYFSKKIFRTDVKDEDVDNVLNEAFLYLYDENDVIRVWRASSENEVIPYTK